MDWSRQCSDHLSWVKDKIEARSAQKTGDERRPFLLVPFHPLAGECSGIRRTGGHCGAPYSLWPLGPAGLLRMGGQCRWEKPGGPIFPVFFNTIYCYTAYWRPLRSGLVWMCLL